MAADHHDWRQRRHEKWQLDQAENSKLRATFDNTTTYEQFLKVELIVKVRATLEMKRSFRNGRLQEAFVQNMVEEQLRGISFVQTPDALVTTFDVDPNLVQPGDAGDEPLTCAGFGRARQANGSLSLLRHQWHHARVWI